MKTCIELHINNEQKTIIITKHITYLNLEKGKLTIGLDMNQSLTITSNNIEEIFDAILSAIDT